MKLFSSLVRLLLFSLTSGVAPASLFDDKSPAGREGEIEKEWRARWRDYWWLEIQKGIRHREATRLA